MSTEELFKELADSRIKELGGFLVSVKIHPNRKIVLEVDKPEGINIADCAQISYALNNEPQLLSLFETHELEVSSPGLDSPFRVHEQYKKNIGRNVKVKTLDDGEITGKLMSVNEEGIEILPQQEKKKPDLPSRTIAFNDIKETKKIISFS